MLRAVWPQQLSQGAEWRKQTAEDETSSGKHPTNEKFYSWPSDNEWKSNAYTTINVSHGSHGGLKTRILHHKWSLRWETMSIEFPTNDPSSLPHFLPREEADSIPFSMQEFPKILQLFSISQGSPQAKTIENTLKHCEFKPIKGETKFCAATLELMLNFVHVTFGSNTPFKVLTTTHLTKSTTLQQN